MIKYILFFLSFSSFACEDGLHLKLWAGDNTFLGDKIDANQDWHDGGSMGNGINLVYKWHNVTVLNYKIDTIELGLEHKSHLFRGAPFNDLEESSYTGFGLSAEWRLRI